MNIKPRHKIVTEKYVLLDLWNWEVEMELTNVTFFLLIVFLNLERTSFIKLPLNARMVILRRQNYSSFDLRSNCIQIDLELSLNWILNICSLQLIKIYKCFCIFLIIAGKKYSNFVKNVWLFVRIVYVCFRYTFRFVLGVLRVVLVLKKNKIFLRVVKCYHISIGVKEKVLS